MAFAAVFSLTVQAKADTVQTKADIDVERAKGVCNYTVDGIDIETTPSMTLKVSYDDNGETIVSYWTTPMDNFGYGNANKTTNKRGGIAKIKMIPNGVIKVAEKTNKRQEEKYITKYSANGFDFTNVDFSNMSFITNNNSYIVYKIKEKKIVELSLKFYSDELDKPFGIYSAILEAFVGGYVKK